MALNFSFVVPKEVVERKAQDFGHKPVGTGAFKVAEWTSGQSIVLERHADYFKKGFPRLDKITFQIGQEPVVNLLRLQSGEIDIPGNIPPAKFSEILNDPKWKDLVIVTDQLNTGYVTMNVNIKPFDNVAVRQAVNMAINKQRIVQIINNRAVPANQPLHRRCRAMTKAWGYAYDVEGAKAKLKEAGLEDGFETELHTSSTDPQPRIAQAIQQDLAAIGIKAYTIQSRINNVIAAGGKKDGAPMIWSGGMAWIADFPDPSNFYTAILGCGGAVEGWNWAWCATRISTSAPKRRTP